MIDGTVKIYPKLAEEPGNKVGILAVLWSFWGPEDYILFQENILPVFRSLSNPKSLALRALDFVHRTTVPHRITDRQTHSITTKAYRSV